jgi:endonuclease-3
MAPAAMARALEVIARFVEGADPLAVTRASQGGDPFAVLVSTLISLRTRDEVTDLVTPRLLAAAPDAGRMARMKPERIARLIYPAGFYKTKGRTIRDVARALVARWDGRVPDTLDELTSLKGVGRKTANLVLTLGHRKPGICVDTHVHRIANRLGFARTRAPDETELVLRARLPSRWWMDINDVLVSFGRVHCGPLSPKCSTCPVRGACARAGVTRSR